MQDNPVDPSDDAADGDGLEDEETQPSGQRGFRPAGPLDRAIAAHGKHLREVPNHWSLQDVANRVRPADPRERWTKSRVDQFEEPSRRATVTELNDLCDALGTTLGTFLQDAGVIKLPESTRGWIEADATIDPEARPGLLAYYESLQRDYRASQQRKN